MLGRAWACAGALPVVCRCAGAQRFACAVAAVRLCSHGRKRHAARALRVARRLRTWRRPHWRHFSLWDSWDSWDLWTRGASERRRGGRRWRCPFTSAFAFFLFRLCLRVREPSALRHAGSPLARLKEPWEGKPDAASTAIIAFAAHVLPAIVPLPPTSCLGHSSRDYTMTAAAARTPLCSWGQVETTLSLSTACHPAAPAANCFCCYGCCRFQGIHLGGIDRAVASV